MGPSEPRGPVPIEAIRAAAERITAWAVRTPLVPLNVDDAPARILLKLENLQPIGSFKHRGAGNAMALAPKELLARGVYTASAGNMAQGVAWHARRLGVPCTVVVPETAPQTKLDAVTRFGAEFVKLPFDDWWNVLATHRFEPLADRLMLHPVSDPNMMAGNGTVGLEILEDAPDVDAIVVPYGGGGLSTGIASAVGALNPSVKVFAAEVEGAAPFAAALATGEPTRIDYHPSFVDGIGSARVLDEMWPLARSILDGSLVVSVAQAAAAVKLLVERNRVVAEGAGATGVAAALDAKAGGGTVVCVVSGGNIDASKLTKILAGEVP
jgi:threonine dehydratase